MINIKVDMPKKLPKEQLAQYIDDVVFYTARITLDYTNSKERFPRLHKDLQDASMVEGVVKEKRGTYHLGARGVDYAPTVWKYPQKGTNWTNPNTYAKWYMTEYKNEKELITKQALSHVKGKYK